jgi:predicted DCC family thiol-disulfide oxidoreductase YuxK
MQAPASFLLLYDGSCGFCHGLVRFVLARDPRAMFRFAALQGEAAARALAPFGGVPADLSTFYLVTPGPVLLVRARASLVVADALGWPWRAAAVLRVLPLAWLDAAYDVVARHRHALFGRRDACYVPRPEERARFLDEERPR